MPALASQVTSFLTAVKSALQSGSDLGSNIQGAAQNYLRAQDMATVLELLQDALATSTELTATGGSTTTVVDGAGSFTPGALEGYKVKFESDTTTAALRGVESLIRSNTDRQLTVDLLPAACQSGDTYQLVPAFVETFIDDLREGKALAENPVGSVYGEARVALAGLQSIMDRLGIVQASGTLTLTGNAGNTETVTIGAKVYTFQTVLTDVDGNVLIGGTASDSLDNLIAAINLAAGAGTTYAASMTIHPSVSAAAGAGDTMVVTAKVAPGAVGNSIATTETLADGSWGAATLTGGAAGAFALTPMASLQTTTGSTTSVLKVNTRGSKLRIDEFRGLKVTVAGESRTVVSNDEDGNLTLDAALTSAPGGSVAVTVARSLDAGSLVPMVMPHPGQQPGDNRLLADLIQQAQDLVVAHTLPS